MEIDDIDALTPSDLSYFEDPAQEKSSEFINDGDMTLEELDPVFELFNPTSLDIVIDAELPTSLDIFQFQYENMSCLEKASYMNICNATIKEEQQPEGIRYTSSLQKGLNFFQCLSIRIENSVSDLNSVLNAVLTEAEIFLMDFPIKLFLTVKCKFSSETNCRIQEFRAQEECLACRYSDFKEQVSLDFKALNEDINKSCLSSDQSIEISEIKLNFFKFNPLASGNSSSKPGKKTRSILKIAEKDSCNFWYCLAAKLFPAATNALRTSNYTKHFDYFNMKGIPTNVTIDDINLVEKQNPQISVNVIGVKEFIEEYYPLRLTKKDATHHIDLLYTEKSDGSFYYSLIKHFKSLFSKVVNNHHGIKYFCRFCLTHFSKEKFLDDHMNICKRGIENKSFYQEKSFSSSPVRRDHSDSVLTVPYHVVLNVCQDEKNKISSYFYIVVKEDGKVVQMKENFLKNKNNLEDCLAKDLIKLESTYSKILTTGALIEKTEEDANKLLRSTLCQVCKYPLGKAEGAYGGAYSLHGKYLFATHKKCICEKPKFIPILCDELTQTHVIKCLSKLKRPIKFTSGKNKFAPFQTSKLRFLNIADFFIVDEHIFFKDIMAKNLERRDFSVVNEMFACTSIEFLQNYDEYVEKGGIDLRSKCSVAVVAECFQYLREIFWGKFQLDPGNYMNLEDLVFDAYLNSSEVEMKPSNDCDVYNFMESKLDHSLKNFFTDLNFDTKVEILSNYLPFGDFEILKENEIPYNFDLMEIDETGNFGYFFDISILCPSEIESNQKFMFSFTKDEIYGNRNIIIHYRLLQFFEGQGLKSYKINKILRFRQNNLKRFFLKLGRVNSFPFFIDSLFEKFKNSIDTRQYDVDLCSSEKGGKNLAEKPFFSTFKIFDENLVGVSSLKKKVRLNSSFLIGFTLSNLSLLYKFK